MDQASLLALSRNPFAPTRNPADRIPNRHFERALGEIVARVRRGERLIPLLGAPGTGKTLLLEAVRRALDDGIVPVRSIGRGDLLVSALTEKPALLLVDEGERADVATLARLTQGDWPSTVVIAFARLPEGMVAGQAVQLRSLAPRDARAHVVGHLARTGRQALFSRGALDALVDAAEGNPRTLSLIAGSALFVAQTADASGVDADHVRSAVAMRGRLHSTPAPTVAPTRGWALGQMAQLTLNNRTPIAAAIGLVALTLASSTLLIAPSPSHQDSSLRATSSSVPRDRSIPTYRPSPAAVHAATVPLLLPVPKPEPEPEPVEVVRTTTLRSMPSGDPSNAKAARAVVIASLATAKVRARAPSFGSRHPISPLRQTPATAPNSPPPPPMVAAAPSASRPEALAFNTDRPTPSAGPEVSSSVALVQSATAREDARAAREAAMEARDAMQIMRTARER